VKSCHQDKQMPQATKEIYHSNGGTLNLDTDKITPEGGIVNPEQYARRDEHAKPNLLPEILTDVT